jgi:hypothetical protein
MALSMHGTWRAIPEIEIEGLVHGMVGAFHPLTGTRRETGRVFLASTQCCLADRNPGIYSPFGRYSCPRTYSRHLKLTMISAMKASKEILLSLSSFMDCSCDRLRAAAAG